MLSQEKGRYPLCGSFSKCGKDFAYGFFFSGFRSSKSSEFRPKSLSFTIEFARGVAFGNSFDWRNELCGDNGGSVDLSSFALDSDSTGAGISIDPISNASGCVKIGFCCKGD